MSRDAGSCQWEMTRPIAWRALVVEGAACDPDGPSWRDSPRKRAANPATASASAAAASPGAPFPPMLIITDPKAGPATAPRLVTAESQPRLLVRCSGGEASATYACTTPIVPPPNPCTRRDRRSTDSDPANAKMT